MIVQTMFVPTRRGFVGFTLHPKVTPLSFVFMYVYQTSNKCA